MAEVEIDGLDMVDVITFMNRKKNKFIAIMLSDLEVAFPKGGKEYQLVRKVILDGMNDYNRSMLRVLFGDVEGLIMK